jgi:hypothetical protein
MLASAKVRCSLIKPLNERAYALTEKTLQLPAVGSSQAKAHTHKAQGNSTGHIARVSFHESVLCLQSQSSLGRKLRTSDRQSLPGVDRLID